jgi:hypothetical protein
VRPSYDPVSFPRRLPYTPPRQAGSVPPADTSTGYVAPTAFSGFTGRSVGEPGGTPIGEQTARALPQRVPAEPDVPTVPEPPSVEPPAETPALARIATHLRRGDVLSSQERQEGFDVKAILAAVREVDGVRDASLRSTPAGAHSLRLDLAEGADPAEVSRQVARLLQDRMGLDAAMQGGESPGARSQSAPAAAQPVVGSAPANTPPSSAFLPSQTGPSGRASVPNRDDLRRLPTAPQAGPGPMTVDETPIRPVSSLPVSPARTSEAPIPQAQIPQARTPRTEIPQAQISPAAPVVSAATGTASATSPATMDPAEDRSGTVETVADGIECGPPRPLDVREQPGPRVVIENVQVNTFGTEATVEVRLGVGSRTAAGIASGPAVDGYLLRLCAMATTAAVDELLASSDHTDGPARCFVEHAASVPFGGMQVAVVVLLLSCGGSWVEQLAGSAVVSGDDRHAMVRATLAAVNRRLEALLS